MATIESLERAVGQKQMAFEEAQVAYTELFKRFFLVLTGEIDPSRVKLDLTNMTWEVAPPGFSPMVPPQINGVPVYVIGKAPPPPATPPAPEAPAASSTGIPIDSTTPTSDRADLDR